tara:strand:+ start:304 stop:435 length:132 start_codon:yes stop_codon:yes gene_type:complete
MRGSTAKFQEGLDVWPLLQDRRQGFKERYRILVLARTWIEHDN